MGVDVLTWSRQCWLDGGSGGGTDGHGCGWCQGTRGRGVKHNIINGDVTGVTVTTDTNKHYL